MSKVKIYRTVNGDTWDLISFKVYGVERYFHQIMRANLNLIGVAIFDSDIPIIIPQLVEEPITEEANRKLPPWKR